MDSLELHAGDCILTLSGHYLNVFDPNPDHIDIQDIAHALSKIPRFAGHLEVVISVAEHSICVCSEVSPEHQLAALLHDASEAYLMDIPKPIKRNLPDYIALEDRLMAAIAAKFGFQYPLSQEVKDADRQQLEVEHWELREKKGIHWPVFTSEEIKKIFLDKYESIMKRKELTDV